MTAAGALPAHAVGAPARATIFSLED